MATVVVVDDDQFVCEHMQERLAGDRDLRCVGIAHDPDGARVVVRQERPDLIVLDIVGFPNPIDLAAELTRISPRSRVVICTAWSDNVKLDSESEFRAKVRAARSGVVDWVSKGRGVMEVIAELRRAARWCADPAGPSPLELALGVYLRAAGSAVIEDPFQAGDKATTLTPTEARIAAIVAQGLEGDMTIEEIARGTKLVLGTIRGHMRSVYSKWGVHTQPAFVAEARRRGLLPD